MINDAWKWLSNYQFQESVTDSWLRAWTQNIIGKNLEQDQASIIKAYYNMKMKKAFED